MNDHCRVRQADPRRQAISKCEPDGSISLERAEWGIGGFDLQAIEAGVRLVEAHGGKVTVLSAGPRPIPIQAEERYALARPG
jgi:electron transfer flavoprotein beta subunit